MWGVFVILESDVLNVKANLPVCLFFLFLWLTPPGTNGYNGRKIKKSFADADSGRINISDK